MKWKRNKEVERKIKLKYLSWRKKNQGKRRKEEGFYWFLQQRKKLYFK